MAWGEPLPNGKYRAVWRDAEGRQRSRSGFTRKAEAERFAGEQEAKARRGEATYVGRSETWGDWCERWLQLRRAERSSDESDLSRINAWLRPQWERHRLSRITAEDVQAWVNALDDEMAPASVEKCYYLFSASMRAAVTTKRITVSPCSREIDLPTVPPPDERFLTWDEFWATARFLSEPYRTAAILLVGTGMRFGEMAGLHQHRVHWDAEAIDVHETLTAGTIKAYPKGRTKRRVPMPSWVAEALEPVMQPRGRSCGLTHRRGNACRSELVLRGPQGAPLNAKNMLRRHWSKALQLAGLEHARQHDLRHSYASWLIQGGRPITEIAEVLGQTDASVARRYAHLADTHLESVRGVLERPVPQPSAPFLPHDLGTGRRLRAL